MEHEQTGQDGEARSEDGASNRGALSLVPPRLRPLAIRLRPWLRPGPTYQSPQLRGLAERFAASFGPDQLVVDVGSGDKRLGPNVRTLDIGPGPNVDVVGRAESLPFADSSVDGLVLQAVLEHVEDGDATLSEVARVLKPGGRAHIEIPFIQGYHAAPGDYRRYTIDGLKQEVKKRGLDVTRAGVVVGPGSATAGIFSEYLALLLSGRSAVGFRLARLVTTWLTLPLKFTDRWLDTHPMGDVIASGVYVEARKPEGRA